MEAPAISTTSVSNTHVTVYWLTLYWLTVYWLTVYWLIVYWHLTLSCIRRGSIKRSSLRRCKQAHIRQVCICICVGICVYHCYHHCDLTGPLGCICTFVSVSMSAPQKAHMSVSRPNHQKSSIALQGGTPSTSHDWKKRAPSASRSQPLCSHRASTAKSLTASSGDTVAGGWLHSGC